MKLKIVSDGTVGHTGVVDAETGERLENVKAVYWWAVGGEDMAGATVELFKIPVEVVGECDNTTCAQLGEVGCRMGLVAAYEEWRRDPSTARPYSEVRAELVAEGKLKGENDETGGDTTVGTGGAAG